MYPNNPEKLALARKILQKKARDNARTPVQWTAEPHAGFTSPNATPWMRVNEDFKTVNAEAQIANPSPSAGSLSVHAFWKRGLENRKKNKDVFVYGDFEMLDPEHLKIVAYKRWSRDEVFVTVLNFSGEEVQWDGLGDAKVARWVAGNYDERELDRKARSGKVTLRPWEGFLGKGE